MLHIVEGNLLDSGLDILVNTVNCVGVSGRGLAKQFAQRYPQVEQQYRRDCDQGLYQAGDVRYYYTDTQVLAYAATKQHWKNPSRYEWVDYILRTLKRDTQGWPCVVPSIALPPLGAGLGGLDGVEVLGMVREQFATYPDLDVYYYLPR